MERLSEREKEEIVRLSAMGCRTALESLTHRQRLAVVLVYGYGWQLREVAETCGLAVTTVQNHLERGLAKLRTALEVFES
jgi:RNA polymerase sigma factor (sigma-70 family)